MQTLIHYFYRKEVEKTASHGRDANNPGEYKVAHSINIITYKG